MVGVTPEKAKSTERKRKRKNAVESGDACECSRLHLAGRLRVIIAFQVFRSFCRFLLLFVLYFMLGSLYEFML